MSFEIHFEVFLYFRHEKTEQEKPLLMLLFSFNAENFFNRWNVQNLNIPSKAWKGFLSVLDSLIFLFSKEEIKIEIGLILSLKGEEIIFLQHLSQITLPLKHPRDVNLFSRSETALSYVINYRNVFRTKQITEQKPKVWYDTEQMQLFCAFSEC